MGDWPACREERLLPISVVVGGQYGSEGKGKVAHYFATTSTEPVVVRVGGPNSGHTVISGDGVRRVMRQLPTAALIPGAFCVIAPGSYIDAEVLLAELRELPLGPDRLLIDPNAMVLGQAERATESEAGLSKSIGSTETGTGASVVRRIQRLSTASLASRDERLAPWVGPTLEVLRSHLDNKRRVILEGTQGYGLSVLHSTDYPFVTSRDTTAAGILAESGLSPLDVDEVILVLRAFPIRVHGNSGRLPNEVDWETVTKAGFHDHPIVEYTSVTQRVRRVGAFDPDLVRRAIAANAPSQIVLNHLDYVDHAICVSGRLSLIGSRRLAEIETSIDRRVDWLGIGPKLMESRSVATTELRATG